LKRSDQSNAKRNELIIYMT